MQHLFIERAISSFFIEKVKPNKVLILLGARRVGKTAFLKKYLESVNNANFLLLNGEDQSTVDLLSERTISNYKRIFYNIELLVIDEAQKIPEIGLKLKLIVDEIQGLKVIVTGSSVFDLSNKLGEPLVGRSSVIHLFPLAQMEFITYENYKQTSEKLEERLIYGAYPELEHIANWNEKAEYLDDLVSAYLLKDILAFEGIKKADKIMDLLRLIAFQIGKEVSVDELAKNLKNISRNTVENYLDLLSKVFIIYKVNGFSRNLRKEITKSSRWYFYDNGIRNAIIKNFNGLKFRNDIGQLWGNYLMSERIKFNHYHRKRINTYFWRTYDQQEIDLIEEESQLLKAYEFKWNEHKKVKAPKAWQNNYKDASFNVINKNNYLNFIT